MTSVRARLKDALLRIANKCLSVKGHWRPGGIFLPWAVGETVPGRDGPSGTGVENPRAIEFLYLDQEAVLAADLLNMPRAMRVVGQAQALFVQGQVRHPHKVVLRQGDSAESEDEGRFNALFASIAGQVRATGMKWIRSFPANRERRFPRASALIILNCPDTGMLIAIMDCTLISAMRTGAMTALGVHYLAPRKTRKIGMIGAGVQSRTQILGLYIALSGVEEIALTNRHQARAEDVAEECRDLWGAPVRAVGSIDKALYDADVALTITTAREPHMIARQIKPGALTVPENRHGRLGGCEASWNHDSCNHAPARPSS